MTALLQIYEELNNIRQFVGAMFVCLVFSSFLILIGLSTIVKELRKLNHYMSNPSRRAYNEKDTSTKSTRND
jgi:hypothetical protein